MTKEDVPMRTSLRGPVVRTGQVLLAAWGLVLVGGCAERRYPVEGVVKYRGKSEPAKDLAGGTDAITTPDLQYSATGVIGPDVRVRLTGLATRPGAIAGKYKVTVVNPYADPGERKNRRIADPKYSSSVA